MASTVAKPAGTPVFPLHRDPAAPCVLTSLLADQPWRAEVAWPEGFAAGIAHRLDIPTSGAVWVADDLDELRRMRAWFAGGELVKTYWLEAGRTVSWNAHRCDRPIAHDRRRKDRMVVQRGHATPHRGQWYPADTAFRRLGDHLFEATMSTGVTHQIRVHAAFLGIALRGDRLYGGGPAIDPDVPFHLHHVGLTGPGGVGTAPVGPPEWVSRARGRG